MFKKKIQKILQSASKNFSSSHSVTVYAEDHDAAQINARPLSEADIREIDFFISMGGDGTILALVHKYPEARAAIVGINLGHLGFMADIPSPISILACKIS